MPKTAPRAGVRRALDQDQLTLFYQPIHETESRRVMGAEALVRARRKSGEIRSAVPLATAAEKGPELFRFDSWILHQAYADAAHWQTNGAQNVRLNVNLSPREFQEGNVLPRLTKLVTGCGIDPKTINLEITETAYIERPKQTMHILDSLKTIGIQLWLDDFGTHHSSLSHLLFPIDGVKLPGDFVKRIPGDARALAMTRAIVELAHELEMKVIAEGVEHEDQRAVLRDMKCEYIQGFLFNKPMPLDELEELLTRSSGASPLLGSRSRGGGRGRAGRSS